VFAIWSATWPVPGWRQVRASVPAPLTVVPSGTRQLGCAGRSLPRATSNCRHPRAKQPSYVRRRVRSQVAPGEERRDEPGKLREVRLEPVRLCTGGAGRPRIQLESRHDDHGAACLRTKTFIRRDAPAIPWLWRLETDPAGRPDPDPCVRGSLTGYRATACGVISAGTGTLLVWPAPTCRALLRARLTDG
jgi:hypothetical protein